MSCQNIHACPVATQLKTDSTTYSTYTAHMNGCIHMCIHSLAQSLKHQTKWKEACGCCYGDQQKGTKHHLSPKEDQASSDQSEQRCYLLKEGNYLHTEDDLLKRHLSLFFYCTQIHKPTACVPFVTAVILHPNDILTAVLKKKKKKKQC